MVALITEPVEPSVTVTPVLVNTVGGSFTGSTVMSNWSVTVPPGLLSSAVTSTVKVPTSDSVGVPLKVLVPGVKDIHAGRGPPPARVAE